MLFEDAALSRLNKAKDANVFTFSKQDYNVSPELYVTENFTDNKKVVATNPQQQNYYWGKQRAGKLHQQERQANAGGPVLSCQL